jgi:nicotinamide mononucleotide transporter
MEPFEVVGVVFGALCVWLTVRENIWCWPTGIVSVAAYIVVFYRAKLYADMGLQVVFLVLCAYGWYEWLHGGKDRGALTVSRTPPRALVVLTGAGIAGLLFLGFALRKYTDAALPFWDAGTTSFSLVAQWMMTKKWIENWLVWIAVDVVYVGIYVAKQLHPTAVLYAVFLCLAIAGLLAWRKSLTTVTA